MMIYAPSNNADRNCPLIEAIINILEWHPSFKTLRQQVNDSRTWNKCGSAWNLLPHHLKCCCCWGCWAELDPSERKHCERSGVTASVSVSASSTWTTRSSRPRASSAEGQTAGHWVPVLSTAGATFIIGVDGVHVQPVTHTLQQNNGSSRCITILYISIVFTHTLVNKCNRWIFALFFKLYSWGEINYVQIFDSMGQNTNVPKINCFNCFLELNEKHKTCTIWTQQRRRKQQQNMTAKQ